jgi:hypothetical protein
MNTGVGSIIQPLTQSPKRKCGITTGGTTTDVVEIRRNDYTPQYNTSGPKVPAPGSSSSFTFGAEI